EPHSRWDVWKTWTAWSSKRMRRRPSLAPSLSAESRFVALRLRRRPATDTRMRTVIDARLEAAADREVGTRRSPRLGTLSVFLANGLGIGAWAAAIPRVKVDLALTDAGLSLALLAFAG